MATYPNYAGNPQNTLADGAADPLSAQGKDYNDLDDEVVASQADLKGAMAAAGGAGSMTAAMAAAYTGTVNSPDDLTDRSTFVGAPAMYPDTIAQWSLGFFAGPNAPGWARLTSAVDSVLWMPVPPGRSTALRGLRIDSIFVVYSIAAAALDDFEFDAWVWPVPVHGAAPVGAVNAVAYDANHNTALKRGAVGDHTMQVTLANKVIGDNGWSLGLSVDADAGAAAQLAVLGALFIMTDLAR